MKNLKIGTISLGLLIATKAIAEPSFSLKTQLQDGNIETYAELSGIDNSPPETTQVVFQLEYCKLNSDHNCEAGVRTLLLTCKSQAIKEGRIACNNSLPLLGSLGKYEAKMLNLVFKGPDPDFPDMLKVIERRTFSTLTENHPIFIAENSNADTFPPRISKFFLKNENKANKSLKTELKSSDKLSLYLLAEDDKLTLGDRQGRVLTGPMNYNSYTEQFCQLGSVSQCFWSKTKSTTNISEDIFMREIEISSAPFGTFELQEFYKFCDEAENCIKFRPQDFPALQIRIVP